MRRSTRGLARAKLYDRKTAKITISRPGTTAATATDRRNRHRGVVRPRFGQSDLGGAHWQFPSTSTTLSSLHRRNGDRPKIQRVNSMQNTRVFRDKLRRGQVCLGTGISMSDPTVCEALCPDMDFFWMDLEHSALSTERLKMHLMAMKGSPCASLVRVPWNDPVLVKPVLDMGADGVIFPMVRNADDVEQAVAACRYPPEGVRGFGPLRPLDYGRQNATEYCREANENLIVIVQIELLEAVENIEEILRVPGLTSIAFGPQDLSASMGLRTEPKRPEVRATMAQVIEKAKAANIPVGVSIGADVEWLRDLVDMGVQWLAMGNDVTLMVKAGQEMVRAMRDHSATDH